TRVAWRRAVARTHRRQLRTRCRARRGRHRARSCLVSIDARFAAARGLYEERAVSVPLLAAAGDGGANAGVGVPAFGNDGEGRRIPARAPVARDGRHGYLVLVR